ncbi:DUF2164 domain-containing protein [Pseudomonas sp. NCCP-436]|uniref:DUF2164 domain-containing protein n=1 Tax=Pseudomonas sp. NCCP-436 TaxID=2842481 RepID=UPI001C80A2FE|nr:DUF2164 domain-containing protein [Pseudomonas sp. NCCP-436]GIZ12481.1 1-(5-phosphoribosyl)-5-[(5-phosphoribosylamino) methylideneamino] imidazole-4-carboxamide isomerase [Pseudomonas sp. NCCP-436]
MACSKGPSLALEPVQERAALLLLQRFLDERYELRLGTFEVQELLDLVTRELAPHYYNKAILDVQEHLKNRFESIESDLWALEKS